MHRSALSTCCLSHVLQLAANVASINQDALDKDAAVLVSAKAYSDSKVRIGLVGVALMSSGCRNNIVCPNQR